MESGILVFYWSNLSWCKWRESDGNAEFAREMSKLAQGCFKIARTTSEFERKDPNFERAASQNEQAPQIEQN